MYCKLFYTITKMFCVSLEFTSLSNSVFESLRLEQFNHVLFFTYVWISEKHTSYLYSERLLWPCALRACSGQGILQVKALVRGFARSVAPSRLGPGWAKLSDPPLPPLPQSKDNTRRMIPLKCHFTFHTTCLKFISQKTQPLPHPPPNKRTF